MNVQAAEETAFDRLCHLIEEHTGKYPRGPGRQRSAICPAHDDRTPSLSITDGTDRVLIKCQAGCDTDDILTTLGLTRADLFNEPKRKGDKPTVTAEYRYTDEHGTLLFVVERRQPKGFRQKRPDGKGGWTYKLGDTRRVLYRLPAVIEAVKNGRTIYITEGEKDVHAIESTGNVATCNPMGAGKWRHEYAACLKGADVVVITDADEAGRRHATIVTSSLRTAGAQVRAVEPAEGCKDATDHLSAGHGLDELRETRPELTVIDGGQDASPGQPTGIAFVDWKDLFNRPRTPPDWYAAPVLARGRVTLIYSPGKTGKSLIAMEIAAGLATGMPLLGGQPREAMKVLYIDQEMTEDDWLDRLTDMGYKPGDAQFLADHLYLAQLQDWAPMDTLAGGAQVAATAEATGAQAVIIDTASKVISGKENENDTHQAFYRSTVVPLKRAGIAVLVLDHTGKDVERGARGGSAKTDNVDLAFELLARGKDTLSLKTTHARFRDPALEDVVYLRRVTDPHLSHRVETISQNEELCIAQCMQDIHALGPLPGTSGSQVLTDLKNNGKKWRKETCLEAYRRYKRERGWEK